MTLFPVKAALLVGLALICGPTITWAKSAVRTVVIENMKFNPADQTAAPGDTVLWKNRDLVPHTVTAEDGSFDSKLIGPGKSWKMKVHDKGTFRYKCLYHPIMKAGLIVR